VNLVSTKEIARNRDGSDISGRVLEALWEIMMKRVQVFTWVRAKVVNIT
jgi:hypothetical protein